jgi:hypothetical protein
MNVRNERQPTFYPVSFMLIKEFKQEKPSGCKQCGKPSLVRVPFMHLKGLMV